MESAVEVLTELEQNDEWLNENYKKLKADYNNQWVAILNRLVVGHNTDLEKLVKELRNQYPDSYNQIAVEYVTSEELDLIL
jgi:phosphohistidine phosphatase SixA